MDSVLEADLKHDGLLFFDFLNVKYLYKPEGCQIGNIKYSDYVQSSAIFVSHSRVGGR